MRHTFTVSLKGNPSNMSVRFYSRNFALPLMTGARVTAKSNHRKKDGVISRRTFKVVAVNRTGRKVEVTLSSGHARPFRIFTKTRTEGQIAKRKK